MATTKNALAVGKHRKSVSYSSRDKDTSILQHLKEGCALLLAVLALTGILPAFFLFIFDALSVYAFAALCGLALAGAYCWRD